ncbi:MAG: type II toxin-antitoxin system HicA family toxin [Thiomargarita sp.]|nr:type II toxin-antitoxin system HicA family toxin [Thiomargarita sp.]
MRNNPKDWRIDSLETIAKKLDIQVRKSGGSHVVFMHENSDIVVTIPAKRPIKPIYINQFLALINDIGIYYE